MIRSKDFRQKVTYVAIVCSWLRSMHYPAFHRPKPMVASTFACVFSCDLIFTSKIFRLPDTPLTTLFALPMARRTSNSFDDNLASSSLFPGLPPDVSSSPAVVVTKNLWMLLVPATTPILPSPRSRLHA